MSGATSDQSGRRGPMDTWRGRIRPAVQWCRGLTRGARGALRGGMVTPRTAGSFLLNHDVRVVAAFRGWEKRRERDEAVAVNMPADLLPLWEQTKRQFKGTTDERLEAFLAYAHDHEDEGLEAVIDYADAKLEAMINEYQSRAA